MANGLIGIAPKSKLLQITWTVSNLCNYRCSYCTEDLWKGDERSSNTDAYLRAFRQIFAHYRDKGFEGVHIILTGGEPTYWKPLQSMIEFFRKEIPPEFTNNTFSITTNLSSPLNWWKENHSLFTDVMASFHVERAEPERFLESLEYLQDKCFLNIHLMMLEDRFEELQAFGERIKQRLRNFSLDYAPLLSELSSRAQPYYYKDPVKMQFLMQESKPVTSYSMPMQRALQYSAGSEVIFADGRKEELYPSQLLARRQNFFTGWNCHIDEFIMINANGSAQYASCGVGKSLGNINEGQLSLKNQLVQCPRQQCYCGSDILVRKQAPLGNNKSIFPSA